jgi:molecular chaperone DnaJ
MSEKDFYKTLGVSKTASDDELKKAYRKLAMEHHPDRNKDNPASEAKFKEISEAYETLKDPDRRAAYDRFGTAGAQFRGGGGAGPGDFSGFGSAFSDIFEDMFGDAMGRGGRSSTGPSRGSDVQFTLEVSLDDAFKGKEAKLKIPTVDPCDKCNGSGSENGAKPEKCTTCDGHGRVRATQGFFTIERACPTCNGAGTIIKSPCKKCGGAGRMRGEKTIQVSIPAGVEEGRRIRVAGEGEAGVRGGPRGDLFVLIAVKPHPFFKRDGANLFCRVPVPMTTAALGGSTDVPTIEGSRTKIKIPPGTQTGQQLRLKGKGMSVLRSEARGDMYIEIFVETPVNLDKKQSDLMKQLDDSLEKAGRKNSPESENFFKKVKEFWDDLKD